jgi:putative ATP-dependent endonuclease of the OLD family
MLAPIIARLTIERFRGVASFTWQPAKGTNIVLGGGDAGKTTILDAIALLLNPTNAAMRTFSGASWPTASRSKQ